jgi:Lrp/AsnC family leucine-responsive transcriptional regulator
MLKTSEKKIIYWLDNNSRMSNQELATKVGLSKQAIGQNITQLQKKGIIDGFITFVNTLSLGYTHYKIFLKLHNTNTQIESEFITYLVNRDDIRWVVSLSGKYDLSFSLLTTNPQEFNKKYAEIESRFGKYILERNVVTVADVIGYSRNYLIENTLPKSLEYTYIDKRDLIDETDKHILKTISQDARMKIIDIAKKLNLSVDVVNTD